MLVPVIGLVQTGEQGRADRYTYLPSIGIALAVCFAVARLAGTRRARLVLGLVGSCALAGLAVATARQVSTWRDGITLFGRATEVVPRNYLAWSHLGVALAEAARRDEARRAFETALEIQPRHAEAENNLGQLLLESGAAADALPHFERALVLEPGASQAAGNLGAALATLGRDEEALHAFQRATELAPDDAAAWWNLALELLRLERRDEALDALRRARVLAPLDAEIARRLTAVERRP
jgi:Flp pilus assembly protein TadD